jgi:hypothetical protein
MVASWRAAVDGKQIGSGYATEADAMKAAEEFVKQKADEHALPEIEIKPSYAPIR